MIKFVSQKSHADMLVAGKLFMRPASYYHKQELGQGDVFEPVALCFQADIQARAGCRIETVGKIGAVSGKECSEIRFVGQRRVDVKITERAQDDADNTYRGNSEEAGRRHGHNRFSLHDDCFPYSPENDYSYFPLFLFF